MSPAPAPVPEPITVGRLIALLGELDAELPIHVTVLGAEGPTYQVATLGQNGEEAWIGVHE